MKKISIIGSAIAGDVAKRLTNDEITINNHFLSISPLSFLNDDKSKNIKKYSKASRESFIVDIEKTVFDKLKEDKPDYIILDLLDCRLEIAEILEEDNEFCATLNNSIKEFIKEEKFQVKKIIDPFYVDVDKWNKVFTKFIIKLKNIVPEGNIILLDVRPADSYITKNKNYYSFLTLEKRNNLYNFFEKIYTIFKVCAPNIKVVNSIDYYFCEEKNDFKLFSYRLQDCYYEYAVSSILNIFCNFEDPTLCNKYKQFSYNQISKMTLKYKIWQNVSLNNFKGLYIDDFNNYIDTKGAVINLEIKGQDNKIIFDENCNVSDAQIIVSNNNNIIFKKDNSIKKLKMILKDNNVVIIDEKNKFSKDCVINLSNDCKFFIGNNNIIENVSFIIFSYSEVILGNRNALFSDTEIRCHSYTSFKMANDNLWAQKVNVINGDGHSIFDLVTKTKINDMRSVQEDKRQIVFNDHIWVGMFATILNGANIGEGSIIGAKSLVKKRFPNNCVIAGNPSKIIKKNISWCRDNETDNILKCGDFTMMTKNDNEL